MSLVVNIDSFRTSHTENQAANLHAMGIGMMEEYLRQATEVVQDALDKFVKTGGGRITKKRVIDDHLSMAQTETRELAARIESINKAIDLINDQIFNFLREHGNCVVPSYQLTSTLASLMKSSGND